MTQVRAEFWCLECDGCHRRFFPGVQRPMLAARPAGWTISPSAPVHDLCPDCTANQQVGERHD